MIHDAHARSAAKTEAQAQMDAAAEELARGDIDHVEWQRRVSAALAAAYLRDDDPRWQSGFDGDAELWREARSLVLDAVPRDGTFLDVGCANGHLMECLAVWGRERGLELSLYGLELNPDLAAVARQRLPELADHIYSGNVSDWIPTRRFTYVRTGLEYVPSGREAALLRRLLLDVVEPRGRVIVGPIAATELAATVAAFAAADVPRPGTAAAMDRAGKTRYVVWGSHA